MTHSTRWTDRKISQRLQLIEPLVYRRSQPLEPFQYHALAGPLPPPQSALDAPDDQWTTVPHQAPWSAWRTNFLLRSSFQAPTDWGDEAVLALALRLGGRPSEFMGGAEALVYVDGVAHAGYDVNHQEILLTPAWRDGARHELLLHGWTGNGGYFGQSSSTPIMGTSEIVQIDQPTRDFLATARVAQGVMEMLDAANPVRTQLLNALDDAFRALDTREPLGEQFYASVPAAHEVLRKGIAAAGPPLDVELSATGHAHIDVAWLWTIGQSRDKASRSWHSVLRLMEQFPEYQFTQSQPQLYEYVRNDQPALFEAIKRRVAEGRWEITGDMWVEADCNLSGAESLARQFLLGRSFFREHFGVGRSTGVVWLPDVFGYAWALPQLIKHADLDYFFTIKIGWSQYNRLPYDSFWWQGLDGTRVLTHFSPTPQPDWGGGRYRLNFVSTYNATATPEEVLGSWTNFNQKDLVGKAGDGAPPLLMAFGYGDGGGGPTREMLENLREMKSFPAMPRVKQQRAGDFFKQLEAEAGQRLPVWNGELYLEYHRGTYTTQSRTKRANRKSEFLLHDAEFLAAMAALEAPGYTYPAAELRQAWRLVCLNQFHDIIPGSSITPVYEESNAHYAEIRRLATEARDGALAALANRRPGDVLVANPTSFARSDLAYWNGQLAQGSTLQRDNGTRIACQPVEGGTLIDLGELTPYSLATLTVVPGAPPEQPSSLQATPGLLENAFVRVEFDDAGDITRIFDKHAGREVLAPGAKANQFQAFEDRPMAFDAWDIDAYFEDRQWGAEPAASVTVVEQGPLRATLEIKRRISHSEYVQRISLRHNSPQIDFDTTIDWREQHVLLKVAFPVDILSPVATHEIQWGNVQRPTHRNTSWDWARFETCAHKWVDLSEGDYGVSLLNDCKYGHDVHGNVLRLSLLRSPTLPDPQADQGQHRFTYSLLPHTGNWGQATIAAAYALNDPLLATSIAPGTDDSRSQRVPAASFVAVEQPNIVIETVKQAEDGRGIIVRGYESQRRRGPATLRTSFASGAAWRCNLLEEQTSALEVSDGAVHFNVRPYEIFTLRIVPA